MIIIDRILRIYDYLRKRYAKPTFVETTQGLLAAIRHFVDEDTTDIFPDGLYGDPKDAVNYSLYTTRMLGRWHPRSTLQFHQDLIDALPTYARERCQVAHRSLRLMDGSLPYVERPLKSRGESISSGDMTCAAAQITESLRRGHKGDYVIDLAEAHAIAHLSTVAKQNLADAIMLRGDLLDRLSADNPLKAKLAGTNLTAPARPQSPQAQAPTRKPA